MIIPGSPTFSSNDRIQNRLLVTAVLILCAYSVALTLSPLVRTHGAPVSLRWVHWIGFIVWFMGFLWLNRRTARLLPDRDPYLLPIVALLSGWGLLTIWRLEPSLGGKQTIWLALCMFLVDAGILRPGFLALLRRYKYVWLVAGLILSALTLIFGSNPNGTGPTLWLSVLGMYLQPSELLKLLLIVYLAAYIADRVPGVFNFFQLVIPTLILTGLALVILLAQRDLGTGILFILLYTLVLYLAIGKRRILLYAAAVLALAAWFGYRFVDIVRLRLDSWWNIWQDPTGRSYQVIQSLMAVANGGLLGRGPGLGSPSVVPVSFSDFIFSAILEETGLVGGLALLSLLGLLIVRGFSIAVRAPNPYQRFLASGLSAYIVLQALLIIGGNLRVVPLTGVTLPFVSYGGSSLVMAFGAFLMLLLISNQSETQPAPLPTPKPYLVVSGVFLAALTVMAGFSVWWGVIQPNRLLDRSDNPRRMISDRYVQRGHILDREDEIIVENQGMVGEMTRRLAYTPLSSTVGYNHIRYGQSGLEASMDAYLRGTAAAPASTIWSHMLLYGQFPPGLDLRLTIDLHLQKTVDVLMEGHKGAVVLMNAQTGEILSLASHPYLDLYETDLSPEALKEDPDKPLINRAVQGQYPLGMAAAPFILAEYLETKTLPVIPSTQWLHMEDELLSCSLAPQAPLTWQSLLAYSCPSPVLQLSNQMTARQMMNLFDRLEFFSTPSLPLDVPSPEKPAETPTIREMLLGEKPILVSPLQVALAASALSNNGELPSPRLASAVDSPRQGWVILPVEPTSTAFPSFNQSGFVNAFGVPDQPFFESISRVPNEAQTVTWYIAGTLPKWQGTPLSLVILLEEDAPQLARSIGREILSRIYLP